MTVKNCLRLLGEYRERMSDPAAPECVRKQSKANFEGMKKHILSSKKFRGHSILGELGASPAPAPAVEAEPKKEVKPHGQKSKR